MIRELLKLTQSIKVITTKPKNWFKVNSDPTINITCCDLCGNSQITKKS